MTLKARLEQQFFTETLVNLLESRGVKVEETYQINIGGNTDFLNMTVEERLSRKRISKTEAVTSLLPYEIPVRIGPSDYVPFLKDRKICYIYIKGKKFGDVPVYIDVKLNVEDSPNSAGVMIDVIRAMKLALDRGVKGVLTSISAYAFKHPPIQVPDNIARQWVEEFIEGKRER
jgi:myo-inositol-1-phosphate synthase